MITKVDSITKEKEITLEGVLDSGYNTEAGVTIELGVDMNIEPASGQIFLETDTMIDVEKIELFIKRANDMSLADLEKRLA